MTILAAIAVAFMLASCSRSPEPVALDVRPIGHPIEVVLHSALTHETVRDGVGCDPTVTLAGSENMSANSGILFWRPSTGFIRREYTLTGEKGTGTLEIGLRLENRVWRVETMDFDGASLLKQVPGDVGP